MKCPNCKTEDLAAFKINDVHVHTCEICHGFWIAKDELEQIKDKIPSDAWFHIDIWDDKNKAVAKGSDKICPVCSSSLYSVDWDNSHLILELCKICNGIWLDRGEFKKVNQYIKDTADDQILHNYRKTLEKQLEEVFTGPKHLVGEIHDVLTVLNLFRYKFMVQNPKLANDLINIPVI
jgi:uncharacterized protein